MYTRDKINDPARKAVKKSVLALTVSALALTFGVPSWAAPSADAGGSHSGWQHGEGSKRMQHHFAELHRKLNLNADQEKLWQGAMDVMKRNRQAQRTLHEQFSQQMKAAQSQTIIDMNALHAAHQKIDQQRAQLREQTAAAWLNLYNALNDEQKATVSADMKARWAKMERRHAKMRERFEERHEAHHRAHEDASPAAPAPGSPAPQ